MTGRNYSGAQFGSYWLITIAAVYALVFPERNVLTTVLLAIMICCGTVASMLAQRGARRDRRTAGRT